MRAYWIFLLRPLFWRCAVLVLIKLKYNTNFIDFIPYTHSYLIDWFSTKEKKCCTARQTFTSYPLDLWGLSSQQNVLQLEALLHIHTAYCVRYSVFYIDNCSIALVFKHIIHTRTEKLRVHTTTNERIIISSTSIHVLLFESNLWIIYQWHTEFRRYWFLSSAVLARSISFFSLFYSLFFCMYDVHCTGYMLFGFFTISDFFRLGVVSFFICHKLLVL